MCIFRVGESLVIDELPPTTDNNNEDNEEDGPAGGGGAAGAGAHPQQGHRHVVAGRNQQMQLGNHMSAQLHGINMRLTRVEEQVSSSAGDLKMDLQRQLSTVNKNIKRLQLMAPTTRRQVNGNNDDPLVVAARRPGAQLSKRPKDLYSLWTEFTHGLGGLKAARDLTSVERGTVKQKYYRRKVFWDVIATHVAAGFTAPAAVDLVYQVYGRGLSVTMIVNKMLEDKKRYNGRPHPRLCIRVVQQEPRTNQVAAAALVAAPRPRPPTIAAAMAAMIQQPAAAAPRCPPGQQYRNLHGRRVDHEALARHRRQQQEELLTGETSSMRTTTGLNRLVVVLCQR